MGDPLRWPMAEARREPIPRLGSPHRLRRLRQALAALGPSGLGLVLGLLSPAAAAPASPPPASARPDPLPSWNPGPSRQAIVAFVERVSRPGSPHFVPPAERIAAFDNDGTLWSEKPVYGQLLFAIDRVRALAPQHPEWSRQQPFASLLRGDAAPLLAGGARALLEVIQATHAGMTSEEFARTVSDWIATARHPGSGRPYTEMVYQPMLELLAYLRAHGFRTFVVSGGGVEFLRPWVERIYGIPPDQVIGSAVRTRLERRPEGPVLVRLPELTVLNDGDAKPVSLHERLGRRPLAAFGNSDGDLAMLEWTTAGPGPRFALLVHHTDGEREWAYDRASPVGRLDRALAVARARGWTVVDMERDWRRIHPPAAAGAIPGQSGETPPPRP
jgi:phosphoserine phosphatase